ncbi:lipoprotein [Mycoplasma feriruminatoris]|uniref:lipoprotein n=1 Tax=Mycoplasma feriruminatoris TaxID=1179777 RepID=UPI0002A500E3|nr:lipoprotein [Mycoplasma feriruminatoris]UKS54078.1 putative lipoprotein [Mycoplasma feriruminatoris]WFQ90139.1 hypothetical protein MFERI11561_00389 [Mycoplasma feriruminatoris]VZK65246.1 hypothetical protein MF5292_00419 [Mycoplasma feriruminatoris]VZR75393.1 hypothetical protein MF5294_00421 [Mycoplasma feriruminatoris]VZR97633.1 hypothetical protein MF5293_00421 [Mycoplasma feriruminatoris]
MKKLLTILGSLTLITSGGALVVACNNKNTNTQANTKPETTPANSDKDGKQPSEGDKKPSEGKQPGDKNDKEPGKPAPKTPEKKPVKKPVKDANLASANDTKLLFDDTMKEASDAWTKSYNTKLEKTLDSASNITSDLLDTWHRMTVYENDQKWMKAEKDRIDKEVYEEMLQDLEMDKIDKLIYEENYVPDAIRQASDSTEKLFDDTIALQLWKNKHKYDLISEMANENEEILDAEDDMEVAANITGLLFDDTYTKIKEDENDRWTRMSENADFEYVDIAEGAVEHVKQMFDSMFEQDRLKKELAPRLEAEKLRKRQKEAADAAVSRQPRRKPTAEGSSTTNDWLNGLNGNSRNRNR